MSSYIPYLKNGFTSSEKLPQICAGAWLLYMACDDPLGTLAQTVSLQLTQLAYERMPDLGVESKVGDLACQLHSALPNAMGTCVSQKTLARTAQTIFRSAVVCTTAGALIKGLTSIVAADLPIVSSSELVAGDEKSCGCTSTIRYTDPNEDFEIDLVIESAMPTNATCEAPVNLDGATRNLANLVMEEINRRMPWPLPSPFNFAFQDSDCFSSANPQNRTLVITSDFLGGDSKKSLLYDKESPIWPVLFKNYKDPQSNRLPFGISGSEGKLPETITSLKQIYKSTLFLQTWWGSIIANGAGVLSIGLGMYYALVPKQPAPQTPDESDLESTATNLTDYSALSSQNTGDSSSGEWTSSESENEDDETPFIAANGDIV